MQRTRAVREQLHQAEPGRPEGATIAATTAVGGCPVTLSHPIAAASHPSTLVIGTSPRYSPAAIAAIDPITAAVATRPQCFVVTATLIPTTAAANVPALPFKRAGAAVDPDADLVRVASGRESADPVLSAAKPVNASAKC